MKSDRNMWGRFCSMSEMDLTRKERSFSGEVCHYVKETNSFEGSLSTVLLDEELQSL